MGIQTSQLTPASREWNTCWCNQSPCLFTKHCSQIVSCGQIAAKHSKIPSHPSYSNVSKIKGKLKNIEKNQAASAVRKSVIQYVPILRAEEGYDYYFSPKHKAGETQSRTNILLSVWLQTDSKPSPFSCPGSPLSMHCVCLISATPAQL